MGGGSAPYTQRVDNANIKEYSTPIPLLDPSSASSKSVEDDLKKNFGYISYFDTYDGYMIFTCKFNKPSIDLNIQLKGVVTQGSTGQSEVTSNKVISISSSSTDTQYPSAKAVYTNLNEKVGTGQMQSSSDLNSMNDGVYSFVGENKPSWIPGNNGGTFIKFKNENNYINGIFFENDNKNSLYVLNKSGTSEEKWKKAILEEDVGSWNISEINGRVTMSSYNANYIKIGKLVIVSVLIWVASKTSTGNSVAFSLPFRCDQMRAYGNVGYFPTSSNYPNLHIVATQGNSYFSIEYGNTSNVAAITDNQIGTFQCSLQYWTND